jgi:hypothetical protein
VTDPNEGVVEATGTTSAAGTVTLSYAACFEVITGGELPQIGGPHKPIIVHLPCDGTVDATGFPGVAFSAR